MTTTRGVVSLARGVLASNIRRLDFPYKLTYAVTERCNCRCLSCRIWEKKPEDELSLEEIRTFFRTANRFSWIDLTGGEIFLRDDLVDIAAAILRSCRRLALLHFPTNGLLADKTVRATAEILSLGAPRLVITVSLDGPRQVHDAVRGIGGSFDQALETFRRLRELRRTRVFLGMTLTPDTVGRFTETLAAAREVVPSLTADDLHVNIMHRSAHYYGNMDVPLPESRAVRRDIDRIRGLRSGTFGPMALLERAYQSRVPFYLAAGRSPLPCRALSATCFLGASGTIYPCTIWDRPLGSVREPGFDLAKFWQTASVREAWGLLAEERCPGCWTPCEAYPAIAGSLLKALLLLPRPDRERPVSGR